jgi:hypothetical protein
VRVGQGDKVETVRKQPPKRLETLENLLQQAVQRAFNGELV